jgi:hypothetical protein
MEWWVQIHLKFLSNCGLSFLFSGGNRLRNVNFLHVSYDKKRCINLHRNDSHITHCFKLKKTLVSRKMHCVIYEKKLANFQEEFKVRRSSKTYG